MSKNEPFSIIVFINDRINDFSKATFYNLTDKTIPEDIKSLVSLGRNFSLGGTSKGSRTSVQLNKLFSKFRTKAREQGICEKAIATIRSHLQLTGDRIEKTNTKHDRVEKFLEFQRNN